MPPAELTYPKRVSLEPNEIRDLFEDFQGYAELVPIGSTGQSGEPGEGQTISSQTAVLTAIDPPSPSNPATLGSATVSGTKIFATITVPLSTVAATYQVRFTAITNLGKQLSRKLIVDVRV
jgi:hypothetical protein